MSLWFPTLSPMQRFVICYVSKLLRCCIYQTSLRVPIFNYRPNFPTHISWYAYTNNWQYLTCVIANICWDTFANTQFWKCHNFYSSFPWRLNFSFLVNNSFTVFKYWGNWWNNVIHFSYVCAPKAWFILFHFLSNYSNSKYWIPMDVFNSWGQDRNWCQWRRNQ